jgi:hypothetical protein
LPPPFSSDRPPHREVPHDLRGRCFNCFSSLRQAASCHCRTRCFRCFEPEHHVVCCPRQLTASTPARQLLAWRSVPVPSTRASTTAAPSLDSHRGSSRRRSKHRRQCTSRSSRVDPSSPTDVEEFANPLQEPTEEEQAPSPVESSFVPLYVVLWWSPSVAPVL